MTTSERQCSSRARSKSTGKSSTPSCQLDVAEGLSQPHSDPAPVSLREACLRWLPRNPVEMLLTLRVISGIVWHILSGDIWLLTTFLGAMGLKGSKDLAHAGILGYGNRKKKPS